MINQLPYGSVRYSADAKRGDSPQHHVAVLLLAGERDLPVRLVVRLRPHVLRNPQALDDALQRVLKGKVVRVAGRRAGFLRAAAVTVLVLILSSRGGRF